MPINHVTPKKVQEMAHRGIKRMRNFRNARLMFLRNYVGQYYDKENGEIGAEALNMIFNAIRVLVPHIVMNFPKHNLETPYLFQRQYGEDLASALAFSDKRIDIPTEYRKAIVDAVFTLGIIKTGLAQSDSIYALDEYDRIDSGSLYSKTVEFDNLIVDPGSREHMFADAQILGDAMTVPRGMLLESGLFKNDIVELLPRAGDDHNDKAYEMSMRGIKPDENFELEDEVEIIELWVPSANATVWLPGSEHVEFDDYLRADDYYGVNEGPYTFLALTPPVPGNPIPVPMVGVWNDLHTLGNRMAKKIIDQAMAQKDITAYRRASADDAQELLDAADGESIACDDPEGIKVISFGGQQQSNEVALMQLSNWFNLMAGNPETMGGQRENSDTATQAKILSNNATVGLDDMKDMVYKFSAAEARKRAWYIDADPLMEIPIVRRVQQPGQVIMGPTGPIPLPGQIVDEQVILTPELRAGNFLDFTFSIETDSMGRKDSVTRYAQAMDFMQKALPSVMTAAQTAMMLGVPFSPKVCLLRFAKMSGIDWFEEVFADPEFQMMVAMRMMAGPQQEKAQVGEGGGGTPNAGLGMGEILQNGQPGAVMGGQPDMMEQMMSEMQQGAAPGQQMVKRGY